MSGGDNVHSIGGEVQKWADPAMYSAEEMPGKTDRAGEISPRVHLLGMTADPLGHIAAMAAIYKGDIRRSTSDVTDAERRYYLEEIKKTHLKAPLEFVTFHFFLEGVTRGFTHQLVRQRTAVYGQESMRFAVKEHIDEEVALPPSLRRLAVDAPERVRWQQAVNHLDDAYHYLIAKGIPAEDARGLLPTNITTRIHYHTNLRALLDVAGVRLCTQAQFEWRLVMAGIADAIRTQGLCSSPETCKIGGRCHPDAWQREALAELLRPICYQLGGCQFQADFDRSCSIRERVEIRRRHSVPKPDSAYWGRPFLYRSEEGGPVLTSEPIHPAEWLADPGAAR